MTDRPLLDNQFGVRIATAYRPNPNAGPTAWIAAQLWETPDHWVITQLTGKGQYDWDFAQSCLGEEEDAGRFASFAREIISKDDLDARGIEDRIEDEFSGYSIAWWPRWQQA